MLSKNAVKNQSKINDPVISYQFKYVHFNRSQTDDEIKKARLDQTTI